MRLIQQWLVLALLATLSGCGTLATRASVEVAAAAPVNAIGPDGIACVGTIAQTLLGLEDASNDALVAQALGVSGTGGCAPDRRLLRRSRSPCSGSMRRRPRARCMAAGGRRRGRPGRAMSTVQPTPSARHGARWIGSCHATSSRARKSSSVSPKTWTATKLRIPSPPVCKSMSRTTETRKHCWLKIALMEVFGPERTERNWRRCWPILRSIRHHENCSSPKLCTVATRGHGSAAFSLRVVSGERQNFCHSAAARFTYSRLRC